MKGMLFLMPCPEHCCEKCWFGEGVASPRTKRADAPEAVGLCLDCYVDKQEAAFERAVDERKGK